MFLSRWSKKKCLGRGRREKKINKDIQRAWRKKPQVKMDIWLFYSVWWFSNFWSIFLDDKGGRTHKSWDQFQIFKSSFCPAGLLVFMQMSLARKLSACKQTTVFVWFFVKTACCYSIFHFESQTAKDLSFLPNYAINFWLRSSFLPSPGST